MTNPSIEIGITLPEQVFTPTTVHLFLYNAAIWNAHRIHYDLPYAQQVEGHPGLLIDGPLQGDWLTQPLYDWMQEGDDLLTFNYSNRRAAYIGDALRSRVTIEAVDGDRVSFGLQLINQHQQVTTSAQATVRCASRR